MLSFLEPGNWKSNNLQFIQITYNRKLKSWKDQVYKETIFICLATWENWNIVFGTFPNVEHGFHSIGNILLETLKKKTWKHNLKDCATNEINWRKSSLYHDLTSARANCNWILALAFFVTSILFHFLAKVTEANFSKIQLSTGNNSVVLPAVFGTTLAFSYQKKKERKKHIISWHKAYSDSFLTTTTTKKTAKRHQEFMRYTRD